MDEKRKAILLGMFNNPRMVWRKLSTLANSIATTEEEAKRLLLEMDARASGNGNGTWALLARVGVPGPAAPEQQA
jgi:hypothetical protein